VALRFEGRKSGGQPFPFPFVEVTLGDVVTRFLVDTGATAHVVDRATMSTPPPSITVNGWGPVAVAGGIAVVDLPERIRAHGIGGILAPQLLAERGQAVLVDLSNSQLRGVPRSTAWSQLGDFSAQLAPAGQRLCPADPSDAERRAIAVDAKVDGEPTKLLIDTGASRTWVSDGSKAGAKASSHPVMGHSIAHNARDEVASELHGGVRIEASAWSLAVDVGVSPAPGPLPCGAEARLGMDVLHDCAIALTADEVAVGCRVPGR
jgi:predicted aspartyl protease